SVVPATLTVDPGTQFSVAVNQNAAVTTIGAQTNFSFDPTLIQIVDVTKSDAYTNASFLMGVAPQTKAQAIAEANTTGTLKNVATFFLPGAGSLPAGDAAFIQLTLQAKSGGGTSALTLSDALLVDDQGGQLTVNLNAGSVTITGTPA